jgi:hypothetical protein
MKHLRIEAIATDRFALVTRRHHDFVDSESAPELDSTAEYEFREAQIVKLGRLDDAAVTAGCAALNIWRDAYAGTSPRLIYMSAEGWKKIWGRGEMYPNAICSDDEIRRC